MSRLEEYYHPNEIRLLIRNEEWKSSTVGLAKGYVQANVLIIPKEKAYEFMLFCIRNPKPCAVIEVLDEGNPVPEFSCSNSDIRFDISKYRIYKKGRLDCETYNIADYWRNDFVTFILGCSFTFENALLNAGIRIKHIEESKKVPMYSTNIKCNKVGNIETNMVVSMRPISWDNIAETIQITSRYPTMHGAPVHIGSPRDIGIADIMKPDFGDPVEISNNEAPVFWACGGTVYNFVNELKCDIAITHAPSHMYILDLKDESFAVI